MQERDVVGRVAELGVLAEAVRRGAEGAGTAVLLEGEAGIGKTHLVREVERRARSAGVEVFVASCEELERSRPLSPIWRSLASVLAAGYADADRSAVAHVLDVIEARSVVTPVLLCVEDLHWADVATLRFVRAAVERCTTQPLTVIGTMRPAAAGSDLARLTERFAAAGVPIIHLGPLDGATVVEIAEAELGARPGPILLEQLERAGGNAFYLVELLSAFAAEGLVQRTEGVAELTSSGLPKSLPLVVLRKLSVLSTDVLNLLRTCSILGSSFETAHLTAATGRSSLALLDDLQSSIAASVLHDDGERIAFRHDIVHAVIYEDIPLGLRRTIHREIADRLIAAGVDAVTVATQMALGAQVGDAAAIDELQRAAFEVGALDVQITTDLLRRAADLCQPHDPKRAELLAMLTIPLAWLRPQEAFDLATELLDDASATPLWPVVLQGRAYASMALGRLDAAADDFARSRSSDAVDEVTRAGLLADEGIAALALGDLERARSRAEAVTGSSRSNTYATSVAEMTLSAVANASGRVGDALRHAAEAGRAADITFAQRAAVPPVQVALGVALFDADRHTAAVEGLHQGRRRNEDASIGPNSLLFEFALALIRYQLGDWEEAIASASRGMEQPELFMYGKPFAYAAAARIALHRGRVETARDLVKQCEELFERGLPTMGAELVAWVKSLLLELGGDVDGALRTIEQGWSATANVRYQFGTWRLVGPDVVRLANAAGHQALVDDVVATARTAALRADGTGSVAAAAGRIVSLAGEDAEGLLAAATALAETPRVVESLLAMRDAGVSMCAAGDEHGPTVLDDVLGRFEDLGATVDADRTRATMRTFGIRRVRGGTRSRPPLGWDALTPSELRVVEHVALGLTNTQIGDRLFISHRTVQTHLRSIFGKLSVSSRAELAAAYARRGS